VRVEATQQLVNVDRLGEVAQAADPAGPGLDLSLADGGGG
jgi:hypothetical protein